MEQIKSKTRKKNHLFLKLTNVKVQHETVCNVSMDLYSKFSLSSLYVVKCPYNRFFTLHYMELLNVLKCF
jgi:hypothetical protein